MIGQNNSGTFKVITKTILVHLKLLPQAEQNAIEILKKIVCKEKPEHLGHQLDFRGKT